MAPNEEAETPERESLPFQIALPPLAGRQQRSIARYTAPASRCCLTHRRKLAT